MRQEVLGEFFALLAVNPKTGRTHQIRVHLSHLGHPIVGDPVYGRKKTWWKTQSVFKENLPRLPRQMLHAETLGFVHPDSKEFCEFHAPMPEDMNHFISGLKAEL